MAISLQRLTIYLYSVHRAVIFAIAQFSCFVMTLGSETNFANIYSMVQCLRFVKTKN